MKRCLRNAAMLSIAMLAASASPSFSQPAPEMPRQPDLGTTTKATLPPIGNTSGVGKGPGRSAPDRILKIINSARSDRADVLRGSTRQDPLRRIGRSVVLVVTPTKLGSATLLDADGTFVTSWHVVRDEATVGVIYMPADADNRPTEADAVQATVERFDAQADLAIIRVANLEPGVKPVRLAAPKPLAKNAALRVVGHPYGEVWTYTEGTLTSTRRNHAWTSEDGALHHADIIEFQTRAVTGNAGGPVFDANDRLIAVDTMRTDEKSLLSMAVSASEIRKLLAPPPRRLSMRAAVAPAAPVAAGMSTCQPTRLDTRRTKTEDGTVHVLDLNCNGRADAMLLVPDSTKLADHLASDANENGVTDAVYFDFNRDGTFDEVRFDTDEDGKADLVGRDLDADLTPRTVRATRR